MTQDAHAIHASCVLFGEHGVLIRGASGTGKSQLALALLDLDGPARGVLLVGDDRILVERRGGRLLARSHSAIAGQIEQRGTGIRQVRHAAGARLSLVVDLVGDPPRLPDADEAQITLFGIVLPRIFGLAGQPAQTTAAAVQRALDSLRSPAQP